MRKRGDDAQRPHAFLSSNDFHVVLAVLGGYLHSLRLLKQESTPYQDLYTKVEIAVFTIDAGNPETLDLTHEEVGLLWQALSHTEQCLALQRPGEDDLERYKPFMREQLARVQMLLMAALLQGKGEQRARLN